LRFAGEYRDPTSGLYYLQARWYDPTTGQFLSVDPDVSATRAPYNYASDDPLDRSDPSGLSSVSNGMQDCEKYENSIGPVDRVVQKIFLLGSDPCTDALGAIYINQHVVLPVAKDVQPFTDTVGTVCSYASLALVADEVTGPCAAITTGIDADVDLSEALAGCPDMTGTAEAAASEAENLGSSSGIPSIEAISDLASVEQSTGTSIGANANMNWWDQGCC
jgi:RHS repeat-associated protein